MNPVFNVSEATDLDLTNVGMGDDGEPITIMLVMRDSLQKCEKSVIKEIRVSPVSIQDFSTDPIVVYPNPVSNQVTVSMKDGGQLRQVLLYDMEGRLLQSRKVDDSSVTLDVEGLPSGVYSVQARTEKGTTTKRICKL